MFQRDLANSLLDRLAARAGRKTGRRDRLLHPGRGDPTEARRDKLGNSRKQGLSCELPDQHGRRAPPVGEACRGARSLRARLAVREPLVAAHPEVPLYGAGLGETYLRLGQVRCDMADPAGAAAAWKRAVAKYAGTKSLSGEHTFFQACCHAGLAGLAGRPGSGVSAVEGMEQADEAMAVLRLAVAMGYRNLDTYRTELSLDPLRNRADFRALILDLMFPVKPFAG